jgi:hypothetical protein
MSAGVDLSVGLLFLAVGGLVVYGPPARLAESGSADRGWAEAYGDDS